MSSDTICPKSRALGQIIRHRRVALGYTPEQLASILGVKAASVSQWELGLSRPTRGRSTALAALMGSLSISEGELVDVIGPAEYVSAHWDADHGTRLRIERTQSKLGQAELAARAEVSLSTVIRLERGLTTPRPEKLDAIAATLGVKVDAFVPKRRKVVGVESSLSALLKEYRRAHECTQQRMADLLEVPEGTYVSWEVGRNHPRTDVLRHRVAHLLGVAALPLPDRLEKKSVKARTSLARSLGAARQAAGLTRRVAAERLGVDPDTVVAWEEGSLEPLNSRLPEIATLYRIPFVELVRARDGVSSAEATTFPALVRAARREAGLGTAELAARMGFHENLVKLVELGKATVTKRFVARLTASLDIEADRAELLAAEYRPTARYEAVGALLGSARRSLGVSHDDVAFMLGTHRNTVRAWERGQSAPARNRWRELAQVYGITVPQVERAIRSA